MMAENLSSVALLAERIVARYASAIDENPCEETISIRDVVEVVVERGADDEGPVLHWFLRHVDGWTLHFNDRFEGAAAVGSALQTVLSFTLPPIDAIAEPGAGGAVVWSTLCRCW